MEKIVLFHKNNCVQCKMTMNLLNQAGIKYDEINIDDQPEYAEILKSEGYHAAPVVKVFGKDGVIKNSWTGFRIDEVRNYISAVSA
mgnify:CR=1 FL=1